MIDYARCSMQELDAHLKVEQEKLNQNALDASANARYKTIVSFIKRKHVEQLTGITQK